MVKLFASLLVLTLATGSVLALLQPVGSCRRFGGSLAAPQFQTRMLEEPFERGLEVEKFSGREYLLDDRDTFVILEARQPAQAPANPQSRFRRNGRPLPPPRPHPNLPLPQIPVNAHQPNNVGGHQGGHQGSLSRPRSPSSSSGRSDPRLSPRKQSKRSLWNKLTSRRPEPSPKPSRKRLSQERQAFYKVRDPGVNVRKASTSTIASSSSTLQVIRTPQDLGAFYQGRHPAVNGRDGSIGTISPISSSSAVQVVRTPQDLGAFMRTINPTG